MRLDLDEVVKCAKEGRIVINRCAKKASSWYSIEGDYLQNLHEGS